MPLMNNRHIRSETVLRRVVRVGQIERWLILRTDLQGDSPEMQQLVADAHGFLQHSGGSPASRLTKPMCPSELRQLHNSDQVARLSGFAMRRKPSVDFAEAIGGSNLAKNI